MGLFRNFPYTNFHEMNLDMIIRIVNELSEDWNNFTEEWDIDIVAAVNNWLNEHPEATTTVQDGSLTEEKFSDVLKLQAIKDYVTPEMFGAKGDGVTDDTTAINNAIASGKSVIALDQSKTYLVDYPIEISGNHKRIHIEGEILYTGYQNAVDIIGVYHDVYIRQITALNGVGIRLYQTDYDINTAYCRVSFDYIEAETGISLYPTNHGVQNCWFNLGYIKATDNAIYIYGGNSDNSANPSYTGEVVFYNGRCAGDNYAVYLDCTNGYEINKVCFDNVSFEYSANAVMMTTAGNGRITAPIFKNVRTDEITGIILNINGNVRDGYFDGAVPFFASKIIANSTADVWHPFEIRSRMYSGNARATILGANINKKGVMFKSGGWSMPATANVNWTPSLDAPCPNRLIPNVNNATIEFHLPYLAPDGTDEVYISQTGATYIAKVYGYNDQLVFDGTSKGQGTFKMKAFNTPSSPYALWVQM